MNGMSAQTAVRPWAVLLLFSRLDVRPLTTATPNSPTRFVLSRGLVVGESFVEMLYASRCDTSCWSGRWTL
jgi:hypothetical protein